MRLLPEAKDGNHVCALLELCKGNSPENLEIAPDYHENNTASRVSTELALNGQMGSGSLDLLSVPKAIEVPGFGLYLPLWVPDSTESPQNVPLSNIAGSILTQNLESPIDEQLEQEKRNYTPDFDAVGSSCSSIAIDKDTYYLRLDRFTVCDITVKGSMLRETPGSPSNHGAVALQHIITLAVGYFQSVVQNGKTMLNWGKITAAGSAGLHKTGESTLDAF